MSATISDYSQLVARLDLEDAATLAEQARLLLERRAELREDLRQGELAFGRGHGSDSLKVLQQVRAQDVALIEVALAAAGVAIPAEEEGD